MTRINCVDPKLLSKKHLIAEYYELPRAFTLAHKAWYRHEPANHHLNPKRYTMGKGHVRFFYNKQSWLRDRHLKLRYELKRRGINTTLNHNRTNVNMPLAWQKDWQPTREDIAVNMARLRARDPEHYKKEEK